MTEEEKIEARYNDYIRIRDECEKIRCGEQAKMDSIIKSCGIGLIGIEFAFLGIIYKNQIIFLCLFGVAVLCACLSIIFIYFSSWYSVRDIKEYNDELTRRYKNGEDIYEDIKTKYTPWIEEFNVIAMFCLICGVVLFFIFVYTNYNLEIEINNKKAQTTFVEINI